MRLLLSLVFFSTALLGCATTAPAPHDGEEETAATLRRPSELRTYYDRRGIRGSPPAPRCPYTVVRTLTAGSLRELQASARGLGADGIIDVLRGDGRGRGWTATAFRFTDPDCRY